MNIKNYNKAEVLAALYNKSKVQGMGYLQAIPGDMSVIGAEKLLLDTPKMYFDYLHGRVMKINLSTDDVDTFGYNRDNGDGAAEGVLFSLTPTA